MSLAQGNITPTRPRIEPGSPDPESEAPGWFIICLYMCYLKILVVSGIFLPFRTLGRGPLTLGKNSAHIFQIGKI